MRLTFEFVQIENGNGRGGSWLFGNWVDLTFIDTWPVLLLSKPRLSATLNVKESCPIKLLLGIYVNVPLTESKFDICPLVGLLIILNFEIMSLLSIGSDPLRIISKGVFWFVSNCWLFAKGGSFTGFTMIWYCS